MNQDSLSLITAYTIYLPIHAGIYSMFVEFVLNSCWHSIHDCGVCFEVNLLRIQQMQLNDEKLLHIVSNNINTQNNTNSTDVKQCDCDLVELNTMKDVER